jgi:hypothetical protein
MNDTEELVNLKIKCRSCEKGPWGKEQERIIAERERNLVKKVRYCTELRNKINKFIQTIEDSFTRQIFYYRYVKCMTWKQVAYMTGGYNTEDGVRKIAERYIKRQEKR